MGHPFHAKWATCTVKKLQTRYRGPVAWQLQGPTSYPPRERGARTIMSAVPADAARMTSTQAELEALHYWEAGDRVPRPGMTQFRRRLRLQQV